MVILIGTISLINSIRKGESHSAADLEYPFLDRLPYELGRELICLSMEDHYVRVHTQKGNTLILMRMSDAVKELQDYPGERVHRSWWVAKDSVQQVSKDQRKISLILKNGQIAPVSNRRVKELKQRGFL